MSPRRALLAALCLLLGGCAIVWDDADGMRHGIGAVAWPVAKPGQPVVVDGFDVLGAALIATRDETGLVLGYNRHRAVVPGENRAILMDCLNCDLRAAHIETGTVQQQETK